MRRTSDVSSRLLEGLAIVGPSLWQAPWLGSSRRLILPEESLLSGFLKNKRVYSTRRGTLYNGTPGIGSSKESSQQDGAHSVVDPYFCPGSHVT